MRMTIRAAVAVVCAAMLLGAAAAARAADPEEGAPPAKAKPDTGKPDQDKAGTPEDKPDSEGAPAGAGEAKGAAALKDLVNDGFVIRTTVFVPADAVTRQLGKLSSDAIVLTLQKQTSTAVCYYTFNAYVAEDLTTIPSCIVHR